MNDFICVLFVCSVQIGDERICELCSTRVTAVRKAGDLASLPETDIGVDTADLS